MALSDKQNRWISRSQFLWRLKGINIFTKTYRTPILTDREKLLCDAIQQNIDELLKNFTNRSRALGFKAKERCWCGKVATYGGTKGVFL